jgi:hypothetical protein
MQQLRNVILQTLKTDSEKLIYELSDGTQGTVEIAKLMKLKSNTTVKTYWNKWSRIGIIGPSQRNPEYYQRICSLEEVGISVCQIMASILPKRLPTFSGRISRSGPK